MGRQGLLRRTLPLWLLLGATCAQSETITVAPGQLEQAVAVLAERPESVTLAGSADVRDLVWLAGSGIAKADLSAISVVEYSSARPFHMGRSRFEANAIPDYAFFASGMEEVALPATVTRIGEAAFAASKVKSVAFGGSLQELGANAFNSSAITEALLPASLKEIGEGAFSGCTGLQRVIVTGGSRLSEIGSRAFRGCTALKSVVGLESVEYVGEECFSLTGLTELPLPGLQGAGDYALAGNGQLRQATVNSAASQGILSFNPHLGSVGSLPADVPPYYAAASPALGVSEMLAGVQTIGEHAFAGNACSWLLLMPGLASIGDDAFASMSRLGLIDARNLKGEVPVADAGAFRGIDVAKVELCVSGEHYDLWSAAPVWKDFWITRDNVQGSVSAPVAAAWHAEWRGDELSIHSAMPLQEVRVYDLSGRLLGSAQGAANPKFRTDARQVVVTVNDGGRKENVKLLR